MERRLFFICALLIFSSGTWAQLKIPANNEIGSSFEKGTIQQFLKEEEVDPFLLQLSVNYELTESPVSIQTEFNEFVEELAKKRQKGLNDQAFLSYLYYRTHKKFLKNYKSYSSFTQTMKKGEYDCLSATTIYALLLDTFDVSFDIVETDFHIYLLAYSGEERFMMESTDPVNGFVAGEDEITARITDINDRNSTLAEGYLTLEGKARSFNNFYKLASLQYYNASVRALNENNILASVDQLEKARLYDDSERFKEYGKHLARMLAYDGALSDETRQQYLMKLTMFLNSGMITASL